MTGLYNTYSEENEVKKPQYFGEEKRYLDATQGQIQGDIEEESLPIASYDSRVSRVNNVLHKG